jgi:two-component system nitrate/nitrite response regulator NarL
MIRQAIADDHQSLLDGIYLLVKYEEDIEFVGTANDGEALVELVKLKQPHVVITDIRMPILDGIEATRQIIEKHPHIKVLAFSMFDESDAVRQMLAAGASGYILKNSSLEDLLKAVRTVYTGKPYFDSQLSIENINTVQSKKNDILTKRQLQILKLIGHGKTSREIADELFIGIYTVDTHRKNMARILGLSGKGELLRYALEKKYDF